MAVVSTHTIILAAGPLALFVLVMGTAIVWDKLREPYRGLLRPIVVVDQNTYQAACRRVELLIDAGEAPRARAGMIAIRIWLATEVRTGPGRHRLRRARQLEYWEARRDQLNAFVGLPEAPAFPDWPIREQ